MSDFLRAAFPLGGSPYDRGALAMLRSLVPPRMIIQVGAGTENLDLLHGPGEPAPQVVVIDADADRLDQISSEAAAQGWRTVEAVLDVAESGVSFWQASNPDENGMLAPELLTGFWPNLRARSHGVRPSRRLDRLLSEMAAYVDAAPLGRIWVVVDCFPALRILQGGLEEVRRWSVVAARVLLDSGHAALAEASLEKVEGMLTAQGFQCVYIHEGLNPAVGHAFFIRDWAREMDQERLEHQTALKSLTGERDAEARLADERKQEAEAAREQLERLTTEHQAALRSLTGERDAKARLADERKQEAEAAREQLERLTTEHQAALRSLTGERDAKARLADERKQEAEAAREQLERLECAQAESVVRLGLLQDELLRAEAQIDLIADILLREPGL